MALLDRMHPARARTEQMVRDAYAAAYQARIDSFPPLVAAAMDHDGRALCAAGLRTASTGFFSECYLDRPVQVSISAAVRESVSRDDVLEATTLAGVASNLALDLVSFVITRGRASGMRWSMFTATAPLRRALVRAGLEPHDLAPARADRVGDAARWGSYYRMRPRVCVVADPSRAPRFAVRAPEPAIATGVLAIA